MKTRRLCSQRGQATVELALIMPVLLLFLFGMLDLGRSYNTLITLDAASREGARAASVGMSDTQIVSAVDTAAAGLDATKLVCTITPSSTQRTRGTYVTVTLTYPVSLYTTLIMKSYTAKSQSVVRME